ncbi:MAG: hypothetical protein ACXVAZ_14965, partial [Mucilaginibacter sp.]
MRQFAFTLSLIFLSTMANAGTIYYHVSAANIHNGFITEKIWLNAYETPTVQIGDVQYKEFVLPAKTVVRDATKFTVNLGKEQKKPFIFINIPVYSIGSAGKGQLLTDFTLTVTERAIATKPSIAGMEKSTGSTNSVLATGNFYKLSVQNTGLYRVDFDFLSKSGVGLSGVSINNIRVYGNGGNMLSENNADKRIQDLAENSIWVTDANGDGIFNSGDFFVFYAVGPTGITKDSTNQLLHHANNIYEDNAYYFLNFDKGPSTARIGNQGTVPASNISVT